jgi:ribosomal protein L37E
MTEVDWKKCYKCGRITMSDKPGKLKKCSHCGYVLGILPEEELKRFKI